MTPQACARLHVESVLGKSGPEPAFLRYTPQEVRFADGSQRQGRHRPRSSTSSWCRRALREIRFRVFMIWTASFLPACRAGRAHRRLAAAVS
jgi:hypothetical protein